MAEKKSGADTPIVIKKYANRRLYNTATSCYVTLDHLCQMVKDDLDFVVYDAKTGDDITRPVLTQIIVEEESKGQNLLPISFLRQLIAFYGDNMQWMVPKYLEMSMQSFSKNQEEMRSYMKETIGGFFPFAPLEEMGKQHMAIFENAMKMITPYQQANGGVGPGSGPSATNATPNSSPEETVEALRQQVETLNQQLEALSKLQK